LWTVCAAQILDFPPGFTFAENPEDLLFGESTPSHHRPSSGEVRRSHSLGDQFSGAGQNWAPKATALTLPRYDVSNRHVSVGPNDPVADIPGP
jgi:hypothetical protein